MKREDDEDEDEEEEEEKITCQYDVAKWPIVFGV